MDTYFAPPERVSPDQLKAEINAVENSAVMQGLLTTIGGLLAVVNSHRQIVALNDGLLHLLGVTDPLSALGVRPGEAFSCPHAAEGPGGCGTSKHCRTCGAVLAILSSMEMGTPQEKTCLLEATIQGKQEHLVLNVRSHPTEIDGEQFLLLFLEDITETENKAALERTFYHDISNILCGLTGAADLLSMTYGTDKLIKTVKQASTMLNKEVQIQRCIAQSKADNYTPTLEPITLSDLQSLIENFFHNHPVAQGKTIQFVSPRTSKTIHTDSCILQRILINMLTNALEATTENHPITFSIQEPPGMDQLIFCVHNPQCIPEETALRIFEHHFSTKGGRGRGIGTFSMKLLGESILKGTVSFTTDEENGTVFRLALPC